jgi:hypothetical protein
VLVHLVCSADLKLATPPVTSDRQTATRQESLHMVVLTITSAMRRVGQNMRPLWGGRCAQIERSRSTSVQAFGCWLFKLWTVSNERGIEPNRNVRMSSSVLPLCTTMNAEGRSHAHHPLAPRCPALGRSRSLDAACGLRNAPQHRILGRSESEYCLRSHEVRVDPSRSLRSLVG